MHFLKSLVILLAVASCSDGFTTFPVEEERQDEQIEGIEIVRLSPENIKNFAASSQKRYYAGLSSTQQWTYKIGSGDILDIVVYDHPELTAPSGVDRGPIDSGFRVQQDGTFYYPHIGQVSAAGRTVEAVRNEVAQKLRSFITEPQVVAKVAQFNSQKVIVSGEVGEPNHVALGTVPVTVLEAVNLAGGATAEGDLSRISLQRAGRTHRLDLTRFLASGTRTQNPVLRAGDIIFVPRRQTQEAYVMGEVDSPDVVDLSREPVSLTQAITRLGGLDQVRADARGVFVFRDVANKTTVYQLETSSPEGWLLGTKFSLKPEDVVYVVRSPLQKWNDTISRLLPTVQAVNAVDSISE